MVVRIETHLRESPWFPWARVSVEGVDDLAVESGLVRHRDLGGRRSVVQCPRPGGVAGYVVTTGTDPPSLTAAGARTKRKAGRTAQSVGGKKH